MVGYILDMYVTWTVDKCWFLHVAYKYVTHVMGLPNPTLKPVKQAATPPGFKLP